MTLDQAKRKAEKHADQRKEIFHVLRYPGYGYIVTTEWELKGLYPHLESAYAAKPRVMRFKDEA